MDTVLKTLLPWIGTALTGPLGGMAVSFLASKFDVPEKTVEGVKQFIQGADPETMLALKREDHTFSLEMEKLGFKKVYDLEALAVQDRDSARRREAATNDPTTRQLALSYTFGFFIIVLWSLIKGLPDENRDVIVALLGILGAAEVAIIQYYFGSSSGSNDKNKMFQRLATSIDAKESK